MPAGVTQAIDVATNTVASGFIAANGKVYMWGGNNNGELGMGASVIVVNNTPALTPLPAGTIATRMAMSIYSTLITTASSGTMTWGTNSAGLLGDPYCANQGATYNLPVVGPALSGVVDLRSPHNISFAATLSNGQLLTWGSNATGALGYSTAPAVYSCVATAVALSCPVVPRQPVQLAPAILTASSKNVCQGQQVTLTASGCGPFTWSPAADVVTTSGNTAVVSPSATTTYSVSNGFGAPSTVTVTVTTGCCLKNIVPIAGQLNNGTNFSYTFQPGKYYQVADNATAILLASTYNLTNCTLLMGKNARIVVSSGAQLILRGATVMADCQDMWQRIEVKGQSNGIVVEANGSRRTRVLHGIEGIVIEEPGQNPPPPFRFSQADFRHNLQSISIARVSTPATATDVLSNCSFDSDPKEFLTPYKQTSTSVSYYATRHVALSGDFLPMTLDIYNNTFKRAYFGIYIFDGSMGPGRVRASKNTFSDFWLGGVYCSYDFNNGGISEITLEDNKFIFPTATKLPPTTQTTDVLFTHTHNNLAETFGGYMRFGQLRALRNTFQQLDSTQAANITNYGSFKTYRPLQTGIFGNNLPLVRDNHFYLLNIGAEVSKVPTGPQTDMGGNSFINCRVGIRASTTNYSVGNQPELNASCNTFRRDNWRAGSSTSIELNLPLVTIGAPGAQQTVWPQILVRDARVYNNPFPSIQYPLRNLFADGGTNSQTPGSFKAMTNNSPSGSGQYVANYLVPNAYYNSYSSWFGPLTTVTQSTVDIAPQASGGQNNSPCLADGFPSGRGLQQRPNSSINGAGARENQLGQNAPNPCSGRTTIEYILTSQVRQAELLIRRGTDGSLMQQLPLPADSTTQELDVRSYQPGVYFYTLLVDGLPCDTKRLLVR